jgi:hypothetical protein
MNVSAASSAAYGTCSMASAEALQAEIFIDITCGTCVPVFEASTNTGSSTFVNSVSFSGLTVTAGAHGLYVVMCASNGVLGNTWNTPSLTGGAIFDIVAVSDGPGFGVGRLACAIANPGYSLSGATAAMPVATATYLTASILVFQVN